MLLVGDWAPGRRKVKLSLETNRVLGNLEGPVLPHEHIPGCAPPAPKAGPHLWASELPEEPGEFIFSLANNHIMDYGNAGLEMTKRSLAERGISSCGAGADLGEARLPIVVEDEGVQVGIISCCEAQFGVARRRQAGVAEFGPWVYKAIHDLKARADAVVVSVHAAVENSPWPSLFIRDLYRSYIDAGADVVHGHHAHVPQGYENYNDGVIFYGMGNFAVDPDKWQHQPNGTWSVAAKVTFGLRPLRWELVTVELRGASPDSLVVERSNGHERAHHSRYLASCNDPLADEELLEALWQEIAVRAYSGYGRKYMGFTSDEDSRTGKRLRKLLRRLVHSHSGVRDQDQVRRRLLRYHMVACESHRQMLTTALGVLAGEIRDVRTEDTCRMVDEMMPSTRGVNV